MAPAPQLPTGDKFAGRSLLQSQSLSATGGKGKRGERNGRNGYATDPVAKTLRPLRSWRFPVFYPSEDFRPR
jgi:hypothetical protein